MSTRARHAMVKANAYGHGVDGLAPFIEPYVDYFGVRSSKREFIARARITKPILVAGGRWWSKSLFFAEHDLTLDWFILELLDAAEQVREKQQTNQDH